MWSDNVTKQDFLGYQVHADLLQKIILEDDMLPLSIGVFGNWGSGKSSLMSLLHEGVELWSKSVNTNSTSTKYKVLQICSNSWQFESYDSAKLTMIETILDAVQSDISDDKDFFEKTDDFVARIKFLKAGVFLLKKAYENLTPDVIKNGCLQKRKLIKLQGKMSIKS